MIDRVDPVVVVGVVIDRVDPVVVVGVVIDTVDPVVVVGVVIDTVDPVVVVGVVIDRVDPVVVVAIPRLGPSAVVAGGVGHGRRRVVRNGCHGGNAPDTEAEHGGRSDESDSFERHGWSPVDDCVLSGLVSLLNGRRHGSRRNDGVTRSTAPRR